MTEKTSPSRLKFLEKKWHAKLCLRGAIDPSLPESGSRIELMSEFDPTSSKEYLDWICRMYCTESFLFEDVDRVKNTLTIFHRWKHRLPPMERDIGRHTTEQSVWEAVERFDPSRTEDNNPEGREKRRIARAKALAESDILEADDLGDWIVASPQTVFSANWWGRGTRWCTSMESGYHFNSYNSRGPLRIFVDPEGKKFQVHVASAACADATDKMINFAEFIKRLPISVIKLLKEDVRTIIGDKKSKESRSPDLLRTVMSLPSSLVDEAIVAELKVEGLKRIKSLVESDEWALSLVSDTVAKWALGLESGTYSNTTYMLLDIPREGRSVYQLNGDNLNPIRAFALRMQSAPKVFADEVAVSMVELWHPRGQQKNKAFLGAYFHTVGNHTIPSKAWVEVAKKVAKSKHEIFDYTVPFDRIDDAVADELANGETLALIPPDMVTRERVLRMVSNHPIILTTEISSYNLEHMIDDEILFAAAISNKGRGLKYVPDNFKTKELCLKVLERCPCAIEFVPEEFLDYEICANVAQRNGLQWNLVPSRFFDEDFFVKAVTNNGSILPKIPGEFRTERVGRAAIAHSPCSMSHVDFELTYEEFLLGVSTSGSLLARVPLIYRDLAMCEAACLKEVDAMPHVPPMVRLKMLETANPRMASVIHRSKDRVSSRYPVNDPIRTFYPDDSIERPSKMKQLPGTGGLKAAPIVTGPPIVTVTDAEEHVMTPSF